MYFAAFRSKYKHMAVRNQIGNWGFYENKLAASSNQIPRPAPIILLLLDSTQKKNFRGFFFITIILNK